MTPLLLAFCAAAGPFRPVSPAPAQNRPLGIALRIGSASAFGCMAGAIKLGYGAGLTLPETVFYRFAFGLPPVLLWIAAEGNFSAWRSRRPLAHLSRAALGFATMILTFSALRFLPLAEATTLSFAAPLFAVILSALVLDERVGRHRWTAVALGFVGVALVMRPEGRHLPALGLVLALLGAAGMASVAITLRQIGRSEGTQTIVLWFTILSCLAAAPLMPWYGAAHDGRTWLLLLAIGTLGGIGQCLMTASLRFAPVASVVPFDYAQLLWAVLLGWLLFATRPPPATWAGAAIIVASGLYTLYRERRLGGTAPG